MISWRGDDSLETSGAHQHGAIGKSSGLGNVVRHDKAGEFVGANNIDDHGFHRAFGGVVKRGCWLVEEKDLGRIGKSARDGNALGFAARELCDRSRSKARQTNLQEQV